MSEEQINQSSAQAQENKDEIQMAEKSKKVTTKTPAGQLKDTKELSGLVSDAGNPEKNVELRGDIEKKPKRKSPIRKKKLVVEPKDETVKDSQDLLAEHSVVDANLHQDKPSDMTLDTDKEVLLSTKKTDKTFTKKAKVDNKQTVVKGQGAALHGAQLSRVEGDHLGNQRQDESSSVEHKKGVEKQQSMPKKTMDDLNSLALQAVDCVDSLGFRDGLAKLQGGHIKWKQPLAEETSHFLDMTTMLESGEEIDNRFQIYQAVSDFWLASKYAQIQSQGAFTKQVPMAENLMTLLQQAVQLSLTLPDISRVSAQEDTQDSQSEAPSKPGSPKKVDDLLEQASLNFSSELQSGVNQVQDSVKASQVDSLPLGQDQSLLQDQSMNITEQEESKATGSLEKVMPFAENGVEANKKHMTGQAGQDVLKSATSPSSIDLQSLLTHIDKLCGQDLLDTTQRRFQACIEKVKEDGKSGVSQSSVANFLIAGFFVNLSVLRLQVVDLTVPEDMLSEVKPYQQNIDKLLLAFLRDLSSHFDSAQLQGRRPFRKSSQTLSPHMVQAFIQSASASLPKRSLESSQPLQRQPSGPVLPTIADDD